MTLRMKWTPKFLSELKRNRPVDGRLLIFFEWKRQPFLRLLKSMKKTFLHLCFGLAIYTGSNQGGGVTRNLKEDQSQLLGINFNQFKSQCKGVEVSFELKQKTFIEAMRFNPSRFDHLTAGQNKEEDPSGKPSCCVTA